MTLLSPTPLAATRGGKIIPTTRELLGRLHNAKKNNPHPFRAAARISSRVSDGFFYVLLGLTALLLLSGLLGWAGLGRKELWLTIIKVIEIGVILTWFAWCMWQFAEFVRLGLHRFFRDPAGEFGDQIDCAQFEEEPLLCELSNLQDAALGERKKNIDLYISQLKVRAGALATLPALFMTLDRLFSTTKASYQFIDLPLLSSSLTIGLSFAGLLVIGPIASLERLSLVLDKAHRRAQKTSQHEDAMAV